MARSDGAESDWTQMCYVLWLKYRCVLLSSAVDSQRQQIILQSCTLKSFDQNPKQLYYRAFLFSFLKNKIFNGLHFSPFVMKNNCRFAENNSSDPFWRTLNEEKVILISVNYWEKKSSEPFRELKDSIEWFVVAPFLPACWVLVFFESRFCGAVSSPVTPLAQLQHHQLVFGRSQKPQGHLSAVMEQPGDLVSENT